MGKTKFRNQTDQRPFTMIYHDFLESELLNTSYQKLLYIYLKKFADAQNQCFPSIKKLAALTKMSESKVKTTLGELETQGVIKKENRTRVDGGKSSNLYTLYDYADLWNAKNKEDVEKVIEEYEDKKLISLLESRGYKVTKENEPETSAPTKVTEESDPQQNNYVIDMNYKVEEIKSQDVAEEKVEEKYSLEQIKELYQYDNMVKECPEEQETIEKVIDILHEDLNSTKENVKIEKTDKPMETYQSRIKKLTKKEILYVVKRYKQQGTTIINYKGYIRTMLYNALNDTHFEEINQQSKQNQEQGTSLPIDKPINNNLYMTKSTQAYNNYSQRQYTQAELDELEAKLLELAVQIDE